MCPAVAQTTNASRTDYLDTLLQHLPAGVVVLDEHGVVKEANHAAIVLLGEPLEGELWRDVIQRVFKPGQGQDAITQNGKIVSIVTCPLGNLPGQIIQLQDVTETRLLQSKLEHQQHLLQLGRMMASLAHQIRTPISSILLYASNLKSTNVNTHLRQRFADRILQSIRNLDKLVSDLLIFSRKGVEGKEIIAGEALKNHIAMMVEELQKQEPVNIIISPFNARVWIKVNTVLMISAIQNICHNAILAMQEQSKNQAQIDIILEIKSNMLFIHIQDNGLGIDKEKQEKIFTPFFTTRQQGTGLGLSVVKAIMEGHDGKVYLKRSDHKGSVFTLVLPIVKGTDVDISASKMSNQFTSISA